MKEAQFTYHFAVDTALPQDWLDAANRRLPYKLDPRGEIGWGYPDIDGKNYILGGIPVPMTQKGVFILGLLAR